MSTEIPPQKRKARQMLYQAARRNVDPRFQNDPNTVKGLRDSFTAENFKKKYSEMDLSELYGAVTMLNSMADTFEDFDKSVIKYATPNQQSAMRYNALLCAFHYFDWSSITLQMDGRELTGDALKVYIQENFDWKAQFLPKLLFRKLHEQWINPKIHQILMQGNFRQKETKDPSKLYWNSLTQLEADYIIRVLMQIHRELDVGIDKTHLNRFINQN